MNSQSNFFRLNAIAAAVASAIAVVPAFADDQEALALKTPTNIIEIGVANTSDSSVRFGEYNGLNKSGATAVGNLSIRGGSAYGEGNGTLRWSLLGTDLGLSSRALGASVADQGKWSVAVGYDELKHNLSDTYQTPYAGRVGGNVWSLPAAFGVSANTTTLSAAQLATFQTVNVDSTRRNSSVAAGATLWPGVEVKLDYNHLEQSGAKLLGFGTMKTGAATGENVAILPNPTNYKTDTLAASLGWMSDRGHLTAGYQSVFFRDGYDRVLFDSFVGGVTTQSMGTAPNSDFHQFNLGGGWNFSQRTRVVGNLSYGRNTQNDAFMVDPYMMVKPASVSSLNGVVVTRHGDLRLTDQTTRDLTLSASAKYDERDNQTSSNIYNFYAISGGNIANYPNTPLSFKKEQVELAADYRLRRDHHLRLAYNHESVSRWCNNYAVNAGYPAGTNCVVATGHKDDRVDATYRLRAFSSVDFKLGYTWDKRDTTSDPSAIAAFIGTNGGLAGQNAGDFRGFYPYFSASRTQQVGKASANWQVDDRMSVALSARYTDDDYPSTYGVQKGNSWSANFDWSYVLSEQGVLSVYATQQHRSRDMTNQQNAAAVAASATRIAVPANSNWTNRLKDDTLSLGLNFKQGGLAGGKLEINGDVAYVTGTSGYTTTFNYSGLTTGGLTCADPSILSCGALPDIKSRITQIKLGASWQLNKSGKVALNYGYQHLSGADYYYNGYSYGYTPTTLLPTNQQLGNNNVHVIAVSYIHSF